MVAMMAVVAGAAETGDVARVGTSAANTATAVRTPIRRLIFESMFASIVVDRYPSRQPPQEKAAHSLP